jgi:hypothetical protein
VTRAGLALVVAALASSGCARARVVPAQVVRSGAQCGGSATTTAAHWLGTEAALREALGASGPLGLAAAEPFPVDFSQQGVVLVSVGQRPTAGYAISLAAPGAEVKDGVATLTVKLEEPAPGAVLAQVVTSPCLLVALPREGLREVRVVDSAGAVRATAPVR